MSTKSSRHAADDSREDYLVDVLWDGSMNAGLGRGSARIEHDPSAPILYEEAAMLAVRTSKPTIRQLQSRNGREKGNKERRRKR